MLTTATKIKIKLLEKGTSIAEIARRERVSRAAISRVISGTLKSARLRLAIARAIGMKVEALWPNDDQKKAA